MNAQKEALSDLLLDHRLDTPFGCVNRRGLVECDWKPNKRRGTDNRTQHADHVADLIAAHTLRPAETAAAPATGGAVRLPVSIVLHLWTPGDEHAWADEFDWLTANDPTGLAALESSIAATGIHDPILLGHDGRVWDGHHRLHTAWNLGLPTVPVTFSPPQQCDLLNTPPKSSVSRLLTTYLHARGIPMPTQNLADKVVEEAAEFQQAWDALATTSDTEHLHHELADVVLSAAVAAHNLGTTVEACIHAKTTYDTGRATTT